MLVYIKLSLSFLLKKIHEISLYLSYFNTVYIVLICIDQKPFEPKCPWFFIIDAYKINKNTKCALDLLIFHLVKCGFLNPFFYILWFFEGLIEKNTEWNILISNGNGISTSFCVKKWYFHCPREKSYDLIPQSIFFFSFGQWKCPI